MQTVDVTERRRESRLCMCGREGDKDGVRRRDHGEDEGRRCERWSTQRGCSFEIDGGGRIILNKVEELDMKRWNKERSRVKEK